MTDISSHPAILAVRRDDFEFTTEPIFDVECSSCGETRKARPGESLRAPCGGADCSFSMYVPDEATLRDDLGIIQEDVVEAEGVRVDTLHWSEVPKSGVVPPPAAATAEDLASRLKAINAICPSLAASAAEIPPGWLGLLEIVAHALDARGLGDVEVTEAKAKFGTLRLSIRPGLKLAVRINEGYDILDWVEAASSRICEIYGTADAMPVVISGWYRTLGARARAEFAATSASRGQAA